MILRTAVIGAMAKKKAAPTRHRQSQSKTGSDRREKRIDLPLKDSAVQR